MPEPPLPSLNEVLPSHPDAQQQPSPGRLASALAGTGYGGNDWRAPPLISNIADPFGMPNFTGPGLNAGTAAASGTGVGSDGGVASAPFVSHGGAAPVQPAGAGTFGVPVGRPAYPPIDGVYPGMQQNPYLGMRPSAEQAVSDSRWNNYMNISQLTPNMQQL